MTIEETLERWHEFVQDPAPEILDEILADEVKFHSPFVWKPKKGKVAATAILMAAADVFEDFGYVRELVTGNVFGLEFEARIGELEVRGIDLIELNDAGQIIDFEVMVRPANGLQALGLEMAKRLAAQSPTGREILGSASE